MSEFTDLPNERLDHVSAEMNPSTQRGRSALSAIQVLACLLSDLGLRAIGTKVSLAQLSFGPEKQATLFPTAKADRVA
ncbi:hypothetical protein BC361_27180 [Ensifer sp. LC54]|nr:hypothetical protein BC363_29355 [Ensifer sp. LC384]OCP21128.1 hypothetical protein BC361_27180 [Ensifer sp. LC54]